MKKYFFITFVLFCCHLSFSQQPSKDSIKLISISQLKKAETSDRLNKRKDVSEIKLLTEFLKQKGYKSQTGDKNLFGSEGVREHVRTKKRVKSFFYVQDYVNDNNEYASIGVTG